MSHFEHFSFADDLELAQAVASAWLKEVEAANRAAVAHCVALSGGRIAWKLFPVVGVQATARAVSLKPVHFFWADERCVPPTDPESNFATARELLFTPLGISESQIHRIRGEDPPAAAAQKAGREIRRVVPANINGQPVLDLIFLGMGEDGHVASLFPGESEAVMAGEPVYRAVTAAKPPPHRVTLGYGAIAAARQVWVLVSGAGKEAALRESLRPGGQTPLARVLRLRPNTRVFSDLPPA